MADQTPVPATEQKKMPRKKHDHPDMPSRVQAVTVKGTSEWKEWVEAAAVHLRVNVSSLVDAALAEYVKTRGYDIPPPNR